VFLFFAIPRGVIPPPHGTISDASVTLLRTTLRALKPANHGARLKESPALLALPHVRFKISSFLPLLRRVGADSSAGRNEQRRGGLHRPEAGLRPVLQPLVRGQVPEGGPQRGPVHRDLPGVPAVRAEGHPGEGHPGGRGGVHGPQQGQARELMMEEEEEEQEEEQEEQEGA